MVSEPLPPGVERELESIAAELTETFRENLPAGSKIYVDFGEADRVRCPERFPATNGGRGLRCLKSEGHTGQHGGPGLVNWSTEQGETDNESEGA